MNKPTPSQRPAIATWLTLATAIAILVAVLPSTATAATPPIKEKLTERIGWKINKNTGANTCNEDAKNCEQGAEESTEPGGFAFPEGVAVGPGPQHYLYVADKVNSRIQILTQTGAFVSMFGWEVDKTTKTNICTATSKDHCQAGQTPAQNGTAEEIALPTSITVDQATGDIYVLDFTQNRVEKYTSSGEFIWTIGGEVNKTTKANICTQQEITNDHAECQTGQQSSPGITVHGEFKYPPPGYLRGDILAVSTGLSNKTLYVGNEGGVQEFNENGIYQNEVSVPGAVEGLAVDAEGDLYLTDEELPHIIRKYGSDGTEIKEDNFPLVLEPREADGGRIFTLAMDIDPAGRLAVGTTEENATGTLLFSANGFLYDGASGRLITGFELPAQSRSIAFSGEPDTNGGYPMFVAAEKQQVLSYEPVAVGELLAMKAHCVAGGEQETDATWNCELAGDVNPWSVPETEVSFQYGKTCAFGLESSKQPVVAGEALVPVAPVLIEGVRPNESAFCYRLVGDDENVKAPEQFVSEPEVLTTAIVAAKVVGVPVASFVGSSSAVMFGELNPENARTEYAFEYAPGMALARCPNGLAREACPEVQATATQQSDSYGVVGATFSVASLFPATEYHYRLHTDSVSGSGLEHAASQGLERAFVTLSAPVPTAQTGASTVYGATSALIAGTIDPDGEPATYTFELGVYQGAATQYGIVESAAVEATTATEQLLTLTGLQPGTEYAYRIAIKSGYGQATGQTNTFTTTGLPQALTPPGVPPILQIPPIVIPSEAEAKLKAKPKPKPKARCTAAGKHKKRKCTPAVKPKKKRHGRS